MERKRQANTMERKRQIVREKGKKENEQIKVWREKKYNGKRYKWGEKARETQRERRRQNKETERKRKKKKERLKDRERERERERKRGEKKL